MIQKAYCESAIRKKRVLTSSRKNGDDDKGQHVNIRLKYGKVEKIVINYHRITNTEVADKSGISIDLCYNIISNVLSMK